MTTTGQKIKRARVQAQLTQEKLAERIEVSRSTVAKWEADGGLPESNSLVPLARALGVSIDYLLGNPIVETENEQKIEFTQNIYEVNVASIQSTTSLQQDVEDATRYEKNYSVEFWYFNPQEITWNCCREDFFLDEYWIRANGKKWTVVLKYQNGKKKDIATIREGVLCLLGSLGNSVEAFCVITKLIDELHLELKYGDRIEKKIIYKMLFEYPHLNEFNNESEFWGYCRDKVELDFIDNFIILTRRMTENIEKKVNNWIRSKKE